MSKSPWHALNLDIASRWWLLLPLAIAIVVALPGLQGPMVFDDFVNLRPITQPSLTSYIEFIFGNHSGPFGRSVSMVSFAINHALAGKFDPFWLKAGNLALHMLIAAVLFALLRTLFRAVPNGPGSGVALWVSAVWLLHPMNFGLVFYAIQRMAQLSTLFVLLGLWAYVSARLEPRATWRRYRLALAFLCWPLAALSKENGLLLPLFIFLVEAFLLAGEQWQKRARLIMLIVIGLSVVLVLALGAHWLDYSDRPFTLFERIFTQAVVVPGYISHLLVPIDFDIGVYQDDVLIHASLMDPSVIIGVFALVSIIILSLLAPLGPISRWVLFGLMFFLVGHSLESTVFPLELVFPHRNYLPSIGIFLAFGVGIYGLARRFSLNRGLLVIAGVAFVLWTSSLCVAKARAWSSRPALVTAGYERHPESRRAALDMASLLAHNGYQEAALAVNRQAFNANPALGITLRLQRYYLLCLGDKPAPDEEYGIPIPPIRSLNMVEVSTALSNLWKRYQAGQCDKLDMSRVMASLENAVDRDLTNGLIDASAAWNLDYYLIEYYLKRGNLHAAKQRLRASIEGGSKKAKAYQKHFGL